MAGNDDAPKANRSCVECGADISQRHSLAKYCGMPCRKRNELRRDADIRRQRTREFAQRNPAYGPAWAAGNREGRRAASRQSYARHRDVRREDNRAWEARNPESHKLRTAERRVRLLSQDARLVTAADLANLLRRYRNRCAYCEASGLLQIDHVVPLSRGGRHSIGNLLPACASCNLAKGATLLAAWKARRGLSARRPAA